jgi:hypothetical protein
MRTFLITSAAALAVGFSAGTSPSAAAYEVRCGSGIGPTKYSVTKTLMGKQVVVNCGPATATVHYKGTTYTFRNGTCFRYLGSFKLNLGSSLLVPAGGNGGYASMTITAAPNGHAEVAMGVGKILIYATTRFSGARVKGTFTSLTAGVPLTGSWNCGEPIRRS